MRSLLGIASLGAGLALGAYVYMPSALPRFEWARPASQPTQVADIVVPKPVPAVRPVNDEPRTFAPSSPLFAPTAGAVASAATSATAATDRVVRPAGEPIVTATPSGIKITEQARNMKPSDEDSRRELVRDIQKELKRVGCYGGETHGAWTAASQRAMAAFTERVNATLPVKEPDGILLTLVRGAKPGVCGAACPSGQALDGEDRCVPKGVLAAREQRTKVADKTAGNGKVPEPQHVGQGWTTTTSTVVATADAPAAPVSAPQPIPARRPAELPGLMTVGGPKVEADPAQGATSNGVTSGPGSGTATTLPPPAEMAAEIAPLQPTPKKVKRDTPAPRSAYREVSRSGTRSVHDIFTHPLDR